MKNSTNYETPFIALPDFDKINAIAEANNRSISSFSDGSRAFEQKWSRAKKNDEAGQKAKDDFVMKLIAIDELNIDFMQSVKKPTGEIKQIALFLPLKKISSNGLERLVYESPYIINEIIHKHIPEEKENQENLLNLTKEIEKSINKKFSKPETASKELENRITLKNSITNALVPENKLIDCNENEVSLIREGLTSYVRTNYRVEILNDYPLWFPCLDIVFDKWTPPYKRVLSETCYFKLPDCSIDKIWEAIPSEANEYLKKFDIEKFNYDKLRPANKGILSVYTNNNNSDNDEENLITDKKTEEENDET